MLETRNPKPETRNRPQAGFTLIELLLAIGLAALLLLVAFVIFRSVARTIGDIQTISAENRLLRSGYLSLVEDADFWHSHANPGLPYLKVHNGLTDNSNDAYDVRPFRRVDWQADLDAPENPNWAQPHDRRSWYRGFFLPNVGTGTYTWASSRDKKIGTGYQFDPDFALESTAVERRRAWFINQNPKDRLAERIARPPAWETWHVVGDYASLQNIAQDGPIDSEEWQRGSSPRQKWAIAKQLGTRGLVTYLNAGAPGMICAPTDNERVASYLDLDARVDHHFYKGEIPWMLNFSPKLVTERTLEVRDAAARPAIDISSYPLAFAIDHPDYNRGNYAAVLPSRLDAARNDSMALPVMGLLTDLQIASGDCPARPIQDLGGELSSRELLPMGMIYPSNPLRRGLAGQDFDWYEYLFDIQRPCTVLDVRGSRFQKDIATELGPARLLFPKTFWRDLQNRHRRQTWHLPPSYTDNPDPVLATDDDERARLATSILRYLHNGNDRAHGQIVLQNTKADRTTTIHLRMLSTTFRGARQYWGRRSNREAILDPQGNRILLGDQYR